MTKMRRVITIMYGMPAALMLAGCHGHAPAPGNATAPAPAAPRTVAAATTAPSPLSSRDSAPPASTLSNPKIGASLAAMARRVESVSTGTQAAALTTSMIRVNHRREIQVYIHAKRLAPEVEKSITDAGASEVRASQPLGLYQAWATPETLVRIANLAAVTRITPPVYGFTRPGS